MYRLRPGWNLNGTEFIIRSGESWTVVGEWSFHYDEDGISEWYEIIIYFPGKS